MAKGDKGEDERNLWQQVARYWEIGFIIPAAVLVGYFLGALLDYWLHTHWIYIVGLIFGTVLGFVQMIRSAMRSVDSEDGKDK